MTLLERVLLALAMALLAPACHSIDVAPWPYTTEPGNTPPADGGASDGGAASDGAASDGASDDASDQSGSGVGGIQANYGPDPLRCDGGLCDTDNYSLCNLAGDPAKSRDALPFSLLFVVGGIGLAHARKRRRPKASRSS